MAEKSLVTRQPWQRLVTRSTDEVCTAWVAIRQGCQVQGYRQYRRWISLHGFFEVNLENRMRLGIKNKWTCFILHSPFTIFAIAHCQQNSIPEDGQVKDFYRQPRQAHLNPSGKWNTVQHTTCLLDIRCPRRRGARDACQEFALILLHSVWRYRFPYHPIK